MLEYTINNLLLQTGIFVEELQLKPELGDFISSKCSAVELFDQKVSFEKDACLSHVWNTVSAKCTLCSDEIKVESVVEDVLGNRNVIGNRKKKDFHYM